MKRFPTYLSPPNRNSRLDRAVMMRGMLRDVDVDIDVDVDAGGVEGPRLRGYSQMQTR